ncbi:MAG: AbrB family transcriptional regulator [Nitrospirae bacterium CG_4_9_14_3_um_filter_41_27]|nr:MAG: AbrB family transcriptional regulator [Nitrospirae bacterium CG11_big_fil_rev_8_21_14_0_20_41_14]PJA79129.1 MAG: AbrB family transcriptional regulator [Nitrospirae bacterium CG_4_9_14_3_um_filter_41_27]
MPSLMQRSLIRFGHGGLAITIPCAWARFYGLKPGGKVKVIANEELEIIPLKKGERQGFQNKKWCKS